MSRIQLDVRALSAQLAQPFYALLAVARAEPSFDDVLRVGLGGER